MPAINEHTNIGVQRRINREYSNAVTVAENTIASAQKSYGDSHPQVANELCRLGELHQRHSDFDAANHAFTKALSIQEQNPKDTAGMITVLRYFARFHDISGAPYKSKPLMQRAANIESAIWKNGEKSVESAEPEYNAHDEFVAELSGNVPKTFWFQTLGGIVIPLIAALLGIKVLVIGRVAMRTRYSPLTPLMIYGTTARMIGLVWICAALFIHFHFFWPHRNRKICSYGKIMAAIIGSLLLFTALARILMK